MRTVTCPGIFRKGEIKVYESIKELPMERYHDLTKLVLQDVGIGSDMDAVGRHFSRFHTFIVNEKTAELLQEARNLHNNIFYAIEKVNIKSFCFIAMVYSINGRKLLDLSQEAVMKEIKVLSDWGLRQSQVEDVVEDVKKKLKRSFEPIFLIDTERVERSTHLRS